MLVGWLTMITWGMIMNVIETLALPARTLVFTGMFTTRWNACLWTIYFTTVVWCEVTFYFGPTEFDLPQFSRKSSLSSKNRCNVAVLARWKRWSTWNMKGCMFVHLQKQMTALPILKELQYMDDIFAGNARCLPFVFNSPDNNVTGRSVLGSDQSRNTDRFRIRRWAELIFGKLRWIGPMRCWSGIQCYAVIIRPCLFNVASHLVTRTETCCRSRGWKLLLTAGRLQEKPLPLIVHHA